MLPTLIFDFSSFKESKKLSGFCKRVVDALKSLFSDADFFKPCPDNSLLLDGKTGITGAFSISGSASNFVGETQVL